MIAFVGWVYNRYAHLWGCRWYGGAEGVVVGQSTKCATAVRGVERVCDSLCVMG